MGEIDAASIVTTDVTIDTPVDAARDVAIEGFSNKAYAWTAEPFDSVTNLTVADGNENRRPYDDTLLTDIIENQKTQPAEKIPSTLVESSATFLRQATFPFLMAGCGTLCAGLLLDKLQQWELFSTYMPEMNVIVTPLLGMKGNLEMTLGSRLSTQTNLGKMDTTKQRMRMLFTNMALNQTLAIYLSFVASLIAISVTYMEGKETNSGKALILCATAMTTGSLTSILLDFLMWTVVVVSRYTGINPDNVTTPFAGSLGDLASLAFLATFGTIFMNAQSDKPWLCSVVITVFFLITPFYIYYASREKTTVSVLKHGVWPVMSAMIISTAAGHIFGISIRQFQNTAIAAFQPIINGIGGNLVSVQSSRISTSLHQTSIMGRLPNDRGKVFDYVSVKRAFLSKDIDSKTARILLLMVVPGQLIFFFAIYFIKDCTIGTSVWFVVAYLMVAVIQLFFLLFVCQLLVRLMWRFNIDPDNSTIPLLTAFGDLSGSGLMTAAFQIWFAFVKK